MKKFYIIVFLNLILFGNDFAQTPYFQYYNLLRKNEAVQVNALFQDKKGFIWFGTNKGLFRFDGIKQKRFTTVDSLPDENVTAIAEDAKGNIWVGHKNGKLAFIEQNYVKGFHPQEGSATSAVSDILFDRNGNLWYATLGDGLYYYKHNRLFRLDETDKMPDLFIYDILEDPKGNIWAGTDAGIAICSTHGSKVTIQNINYDKGLPDNIIKKLELSNDGTIWLGTDGAGIINYNPKTTKYKPLLKNDWDYGAVTDFLFSGNKVWISSAQNGLMEYDLNSAKIRLLNTGSPTNLTAVNKLLKDTEGNIWAGTMSGVIRTPGDHIEHIETFKNTKEANVVALTIDNEGAIWFSNSEGLYKRSVNSEGTISTMRQLTNTAYKDYNIICLFTDEEGCIWAGSYGEGVLRINPATGKIHSLKNELHDGNILSITGKNNTVWLATLGGATQIIVHKDELTIKNYTREDGLSSEYIYQVFIDSKNRVWLGTDGKGVDMLDQNGFHHFYKGLHSKVVYGFAEDINHNIWINVQNDGIYKLDDEMFYALNNSNGLHDNNISSLVSDSSGNLLMMHDFGIEIYDVNNNKISFHGEQAGIRDQKSNLNTVAKDLHGNIFFGTDKGIVVYSDKTKSSLNNPVPLIEGLKVFDETFALAENLAFKHFQNDITINYLGFWYQNPDNIQYLYKLENYDHDWITSRNEAVTYSSLPPGNYTFRLKVSDTEDFNNTKETSVSFIIYPPFWKTTWFYFLSAAILILLAYTIIKIRERKLKRDNKILEAKNDELKKINMELDRFVYSVSHDLRAPLLSIQGIADITAEVTEEEITREHMEMITGSITRLDNFIGDILAYSRNSRSELKKESIDFKNFLDCIAGDLKFSGSEAKPVEIILDINENGMFCSDKGRLGVVMNNLISNSIRYHNPEVENPFVKVKINTDNSKLQIEVEDNGIGIKEADQQKVFDMFYRASENSVGSGLGLYIVKETVDKLQGNISIESQPGIGTKFTLDIPNLFYQ